MANQNVVSLNMPVQTLIEFLNALHLANADGEVAEQLANALAAMKVQHRDGTAKVDPATSFHDHGGLAEDEKAHLTTFTTHFTMALNTVCCHRKDGIPCGPNQPPCPGDPVPSTSAVKTTA